MTTLTPTACIVIIGNEILSGRTQDSNINFLATQLGGAGIPVREVRVIPDVEETIVATINELRPKYTYIFTTGGIGPTHDDITSQCIAKAFGVPLVLDPVAVDLLNAYYQPKGIELNEARLRMAHVPQGARLLENPVSNAPGFCIGNVYVLPGVPRIMQGIFNLLLPSLAGGPPVVMRSVTCFLGEGDLARDLEAIQNRYPMIDIGSYPFQRDGRFATQLVCKGIDAEAVNAANNEVAELVRKLGGVPEVA